MPKSAEIDCDPERPIPCARNSGLSNELHCLKVWVDNMFVTGRRLPMNTVMEKDGSQALVVWRWMYLLPVDESALESGF